jgi:CHRD domain
MRRLGLVLAFVAGAALILTAISLAKGRDGDKRGKGSIRIELRANGNTQARLDGLQETPVIWTQARGSFSAEVEGNQITFQLRYSGLEGGNASVAHLHLGQRDVAGLVIAFLCGGGGQAACPAGASATVNGTIVAANVVGPAGQGIAAGQFDKLVAAIRAGVVYANVHNAMFPNGEIRGQLRGGRGGNEDDDD